MHRSQSRSPSLPNQNRQGFVARAPRSPSPEPAPYRAGDDSQKERYIDSLRRTNAFGPYYDPPSETRGQGSSNGRFGEPLPSDLPGPSSPSSSGHHQENHRRQQLRYSHHLIEDEMKIREKRMAEISDAARTAAHENFAHLLGPPQEPQEVTGSNKSLLSDAFRSNRIPHNSCLEKFLLTLANPADRMSVFKKFGNYSLTNPLYEKHYTPGSPEVVLTLIRFLYEFGNMEFLNEARHGKTDITRMIEKLKSENPENELVQKLIVEIDEILSSRPESDESVDWLAQTVRHLIANGTLYHYVVRNPKLNVPRPTRSCRPSFVDDSGDASGSAVRGRNEVAHVPPRSARLPSRFTIPHHPLLGQRNPGNGAGTSSSSSAMSSISTPFGAHNNRSGPQSTIDRHRYGQLQQHPFGRDPIPPVQQPRMKRPNKEQRTIKKTDVKSTMERDTVKLSDYEEISLSDGDQDEEPVIKRSRQEESAKQETRQQHGELEEEAPTGNEIATDPEDVYNLRGLQQHMLEEPRQEVGVPVGAEELPVADEQVEDEQEPPVADQQDEDEQEPHVADQHVEDGQEEPVADQQVGDGQEEPVADQQDEDEQEPHVADQHVEDGQEEPVADQQVGDGQEEPVADQQDEDEQEPHVADQHVEDGQEEPVADQQVGDGQEEPVADQHVEDGQEQPVADHQVGDGQDPHVVDQHVEDGQEPPVADQHVEDRQEEPVADQQVGDGQEQPGAQLEDIENKNPEEHKQRFYYECVLPDRYVEGMVRLKKN